MVNSRGKGAITIMVVAGEGQEMWEGIIDDHKSWQMHRFIFVLFSILSVTPFEEHL